MMMNKLCSFSMIPVLVVDLINLVLIRVSVSIHVLSSIIYRERIKYIYVCVCIN